jgi:2-methylcitrate dehydratase
MTGPAPIFEGDKGFEKLVSGPLELRGPLVGEKDELMIVRTSIKCWPVEYHAQSAVQAALELRAEIGDVLRIESVLIESHDAAVDIIGSEPEKWRPTTRETADHSLPYIVGVALMDGEVTHRQFDADRIADLTLLAFLQRIKVQRHVELSAMYPGAVGNIVTIRLNDGRTISRRVDHALGHSANPMSDAAVVEKYHRLADPLLGRARAERAAEWVWQLENADSVAALMPLLLTEEAI